MSHVYKTQSLLTIVLETRYSSLDSADVKKILWTKPDGKDGQWTAVVAGTTLTYNLQNGDIDRSGLWQFQAYIEVGGLKAYGEIVSIDFKLPLE